MKEAAKAAKKNPATAWAWGLGGAVAGFATMVPGE